MKERERDYRSEAKQKLEKWLKEHPLDIDFSKQIDNKEEDQND